MSIPLIALEEHFLSTDSTSLTPLYSEQLRSIPNLSSKLHDLSTLRLSHMNKAHISLQLISHAPGAMPPSQCTSANNQLATAISANSTRFAGLAVLPMSSPLEAATELTRTMTELKGFVGALIDNRAGDTYYDSEPYQTHFWPVVSRLNVPIYLHPTWASDTQLQTLYTGNFPHPATLSLAASGWG